MMSGKNTFKNCRGNAVDRYAAKCSDNPMTAFIHGFRAGWEARRRYEKERRVSSGGRVRKVTR
jgi:hypothetical protein